MEQALRSQGVCAEGEAGTYRMSKPTSTFDQVISDLKRDQTPSGDKEKLLHHTAKSEEVSLVR